MSKNETVPKDIDYDVNDVAYIFSQETFTSWDGVLDWLTSDGPHESQLSSDVKHYLYSDFHRLSELRVPFTLDSRTATKLAKETRYNSDLEIN